VDVSLGERLAPDADAGQRRLIALLGAGVVGLTWSLTTVAAYLPEILHRYTSSRTVVGGILGGEGIVAIAAPLVFGPLSDRLRTRWGRRRPFMAVGTPLMVAALCAVALMPGLVTTALVLGCFFVAYYVYETPYRSLYADCLPREVESEAQSVQHLFRGVAIGLSLVLGGVLLSLARPLPFLLSAGIVAASAFVTIRGVREESGRRRQPGRVTEPFRVAARCKPLRRFLVANTAWETTFAGMRTFVVLYIVQGLHQPLYVSSVVLAVVAAGYIVAAATVGRLAASAGRARVVLVAASVYGALLWVGVFPSRWQWYYLGLVFVVAVAAGAVMTLAWSLLYEVMPEDERGSSAGLADATKGVGLLLGPALTGLAIDLAHGWLSATDGYAIMWPVLAVPILASLPVVRSLR
jgi:Na+/melibiose symporter-like transporter